MSECPHAKEIGALEAKAIMFEKRLESVEIITRNNAEVHLTKRVSSETARKWIDIIARFIGYTVVIGVLVAAGKVTSLVELLLRLLRL